MGDTYGQDTIPPLDRRNKILAENEHFSQTRYDPSLPDLRELAEAPETDVAALFTPPPVLVGQYLEIILGDNTWRQYDMR